MSLRPTRIALLVLATALPLGAFGARERGADPVAELRVTVESVSAAVASLERQVAPGRGFLTEADAVRRFEDYVYLHLIGEHAAAAEGFFTLVTLAALGDAGLHRDAEWYLAESLFEMGNTTTAEARYRVIADDRAHPFRDDAVRRLLELYATTGQVERFDVLYHAEILEGRVQPSPLITYSLAKSFYRRGELDTAASYFDSLDPQSRYGRKGVYFLGVIDVVRGDLDAAIERFRAVTDGSVESVDDRKLHDLALLAVARIHYERGDLEQAADAYGRIGGDSPHLAEKLYEVIWTYIKQERFRAALDGVEIFLIRYPDHAYSAQLQLLEGHLHLEQKAYPAALGTYEQVISEYTPVRERFAELARSDEEPRALFRQLVIGARGDRVRSEGLPGYAVAMLLGDPSLSTALELFGELDRQERQVDGSLTLIGELREVMDTASGIGGYERLRYEVAVEQGRATDAQLRLLAIEAAWLAEHATADRRGALEDLERMRRELEGMVARLPSDLGGEHAMWARLEHVERVATLEGRVAALRAELEEVALDPPSPGSPDADPDDAPQDAADEEVEPADTGPSPLERALDEALAELEAVRAAGPSTAWSDRIAELEQVIAVTVEELRLGYLALREGIVETETPQRIDRLQTLLHNDQGRLAALRDRLVTAESAELSRIRSRFEHEVIEVGAQRVGLAETSEQAEDVSAALTRVGFGRLEETFAESLLRADMGVVDVYWSQKIDVADQREGLVTERAEVLSDLTERFRLIREKLEP